tara:strand:+ start:126 stop:539 length:414 start_codon:yes stop_codon:yes gene_type:complete
MNRKAQSRRQKEKQAAAFVGQHHDQMLSLLLNVTEDIGEELVGLNQIQRDSRLALEMAYRLDKAIEIPNELIEALDFFGFFLASLAAIGIYRAIERSMKRKKETAEKLKRRLDERGPRMAIAARRRIERRIKRLESK